MNTSRRIASSLFAGFITLALAAVCLLGLSACSYRCPYDWSGLRGTGVTLAYYEKGTLCSELGIDVSEFQGDIAWFDVAHEGVEFAYVRIGWRGSTEGNIYADARYAQNIFGARAAGLQVGVYFFSQATCADEAIEEAEFVLNILRGRSLDLPVAYDFEKSPDGGGRADGISNEARTACAEAFCSTIENAGYRTIIYGNKRDIPHLDESVTKKRPVWLAEYTHSAPSALFDYSIWQFTSGGTVKGIDGDVDMDLLFLTAPKPVLASS